MKQLTVKEFNAFKAHIKMEGQLSKETISKIMIVLEDNTLDSIPIVSCCHPDGKCSCDTFGEINECKYQC